MQKVFSKLLMAALLLSWAAGVQAVIVGVDIEAGQGSPTNWTSYTIADVDSPVTNLVAEDGSGTSISFQLDGVDTAQNVAPSSGDVIPSHTNDLTTVCCDLLYSGPNPTIATWSGLEPLATYNYWVFVSSTATDTMTVTGSNVDQFNSPNIGPSTQAINGILGDSALSFASYARQIVASETGTVEIAIQSTGTPTPSGYAIEFVESGLSASPVPGLNAIGIGLTALLLLLFAAVRLRAART